MATIIELPKLYENMDEATIGPWQVKVGQAVKKDDFLVELITDKTVSELEAPENGTVLAIYAEEKSTVPHGYALCAIGAAGEAAPDVAAANEAKVAAHLKATAGGIDLGDFASKAPAAEEKPAFRAAPAAKVFARQQGVELADVAAFCKRDMIHRKDVEDYIASKQAPAAESKPAAPVAKPAAAAAAPKAAPIVVNPLGGQKGRVALITGATGGIGVAIARRLAADGATLALHYRSNPDAAAKLADELRAAGATCETFQADLAAKEGDPAKELVNAVVVKFGRLDILVNNAGILNDATVSFMSDEQWTDTLNMDLTVPFKLIRAAAMNMARQRWGRIVNMASDAGRMGSANRSNYAAAKECLVGLTRSIARELAGLGVRANAVSPGFVETNMVSNITDKRRAELYREIPCRRFAKPEEVAALIAFLCSDDADYITGQVISINGGLCM
ncbi:MAG: 3-oxoacyl-ACP reductase FabG [Victivallales bacterium]|nr:3-oxoacyl-ACP reductase FabG [Victivallales bacterium]